MKKSGKKEPVFINGFLYYSFFTASVESGLSSVGLWKALKKSDGLPVPVKKNLIATEAWTLNRKCFLKMEYGL
ncbi:hypothetical protein E4N82_10105 [Treponema denticola]|uniref:hypothetical protein n=1 Tax=Treponema denticola TaxID=158 RepID=UPI0040378A93